jgi:hypothetical protein
MKGLDEMILAWDENLGGGGLKAGNHSVKITDIIVEPERDGEKQIRLVFSNNYGSYNQWATYAHADKEQSWKVRKGKELIMKIRDTLGVVDMDLTLLKLAEALCQKPLAIALRKNGEKGNGYDRLVIEEIAAEVDKLPPMPMATPQPEQRENRFQ